MDRIYTQAEKVICWLCGASETFYRLLDFLSVIDRSMVREYIQQETKAASDDAIWEGIHEMIRGQTSFMSLTAEEGTQLFQALKDLMQLHWFHRVWTVQEAVLAKVLFFQAGSKVVPATALGNLVEMLQSAGHSSLSSVHTGYLVKPASIFALHDLYIAGKLSSVDPSVLLDASKHRGVTDDRDRVFGLLGLLTMALGSQFAGVSYDKSVELTYMEMTVRLMVIDKSPDPIKFCCAMRKGSQYHIPSWSEDWSARAGCGAQNARSMLERPRIYHASSHKAFLVGSFRQLKHF
ncbi:Nn.00g001550.m01.CDS01 [Neocucurbitaria sp. VM-36]